MSKQVEVVYHDDRETDVWWAEAPAVAGFSAGAQTLAELRARTREALTFFLEEEDVEVVESIDDDLPGGAVWDVPAPSYGVGTTPGTAVTPMPGSPLVTA